MVAAGDDNCVTKLSELLQISRITAGKKLKGEAQFTQLEIETISKYYDFTAEEIQTIFINGE